MRIAYLLLLPITLAMAADPVKLSMKRAVDVAISPEGSARVQLADESLKQAQARALEQRAALLPNVDASFTDQSRTQNLAALGFNSAIFSAIPLPGFSFPTTSAPSAATRPPRWESPRHAPMPAPRRSR
jgi:outer membrane protein TolC